MARQREERRARPRVTPQDVRNNANTGSRTAGFFSLPKGIRTWDPPKANTYDIDFLAYEVKTSQHPDRVNNVVPGALWYKHPFVIFRKVGVNQTDVVSPATVGKPCPLMEQYNALREDYEANKVKIRAMGMQKWTAFVIADPDDPEKVAVYATSDGKFWTADAGLKNEMDQADDDKLLFWYPEGGHTLACRFADATFTPEGGGSQKFIQCTRIDFKPRPDMDEDEVIAKTPCLEECFNILDYSVLEKMYYGDEDPLPNSPTGTAPQAPQRKAATPAAAPAPAKPAPKATPSGTSRGKATTPPPPPAEEPEVVEEDGHEGPPFAEGDKVTFESTFDGVDKTVLGVVKSVDETNQECCVEDQESGDEFDVPWAELLIDKDAGNDEAPGEETAEEGAEDAGTAPEEDNDGAPAEENAGAAPTGDRVKAKADRKPKVGERVETDTKLVGTVTKVDGDDVSIKLDTGAAKVIDKDDIAYYIGGAAPAGKPAAAPKADAPKAFAEGDNVLHNGKEVKIVKLKELKARVEDDKGDLNWVELAKLTHKPKAAARRGK
jgi:hypothetical protein